MPILDMCRAPIPESDIHNFKLKPGTPPEASIVVRLAEDGLHYR